MIQAAKVENWTEIEPVIVESYDLRKPSLPRKKSTKNTGGKPAKQAATEVGEKTVNKAGSIKRAR